MERYMKRNPEPLSGSMYQILRKDILQGKFNPGEKLTEQMLCDAYDMSRTPIREALRQLELEGLIETIPNRGAFVVGLSKQDIIDLYAMQKEFEVLAVKWAIQRATEDEIAKLQELCEFMEFYAQRGDGDKMKEINSQFHELIYAASHNKLLAQTLSTYQAYSRLTDTNTGYVHGKMDEVLVEHKAIMNAFKNRDMQGGAEAVAVHIDHAISRANF